MDNARRNLNLIIVFFCLALLVVVIFYLNGSSAYRYSGQQLELIKEFGWPDHFSISFPVDEDGSQGRLETWYFHNYGIGITFFNGEFSGEEDIDDLPPEAIAASYQPGQFTSDMNWEDVLAQIGDKPWEKASNILPELFLDTELELYYSEQIVAGFDTGLNQLVYLETMALVPEEEQ